MSESVQDLVNAAVFAAVAILVFKLADWWERRKAAREALERLRQVEK